MSGITYLFKGYIEGNRLLAAFEAVDKANGKKSFAKIDVTRERDLNLKKDDQ